MTMTKEEAAQALIDTNTNIAIAAGTIARSLDTILQLLEEPEHVDAIMPILDPTLYMNKERQQASEIMTPLYRSALQFFRDYEESVRKLKGARDNG